MPGDCLVGTLRIATLLHRFLPGSNRCRFTAGGTRRRGYYARSSGFSRLRYPECSCHAAPTSDPGQWAGPYLQPISATALF